MFDGHGGGACAQVVAKRLYQYITACLLPYEKLMQYLLSLTKSDSSELIQTYNDKVQFVDDIREIYSKSFLRFVKDLSEVCYNCAIFHYSKIKFSYEFNRLLEKVHLKQIHSNFYSFYMCKLSKFKYFL